MLEQPAAMKPLTILIVSTLFCSYYNAWCVYISIQLVMQHHKQETAIVQNVYIFSALLHLFNTILNNIYHL